MVQTQWQQTLRRKIGLSGAFFRITYNQSAETKWTRRVFHRFNLAIGGGSLAQAQCLFRRLLAYSYSAAGVLLLRCWRTPTPMILAFMQKKSMGEQGTRKQCLELYLCFVSAQLMNCRGRGGTDFYRFLCLRLVRSGTVADRATPRAPAPEGRLYEAAFTSSNRR